MSMNRSKSYAPGLGQHNNFDFVGSVSMDRRQNYSSPSYPPSQHFDYNAISSITRPASKMSSHLHNLESEWNFDTPSMTDLTTPPLQHRPMQETFLELDPQDYIQQRLGTGLHDVEHQYINAGYLVNPHLDGLVSPTSIMATNWPLEANTADLSRTNSMASYVGGANQLSPVIDMSRLHSSATLFAHSGRHDSLPMQPRMNSSRNLGHRSSFSDHQASLKSPLHISTANHHRSRSSIQSLQSISSQSSILSPHSSMSRSLSTASSATTASDPALGTFKPTHSRKTSSRSTRSLAPKATETIEPTGSANMVRIKSSDGTSREAGVLPRIKASASTRAVGLQKLLCDHCDEVPDGFRGEHELMRHYNLRHAPRRKGFKCIEPPGQEGFFALVGCRSCKEEKIYGAYYNAAAHLRRVHFDPRPRGRKAKNSAERRGGKAGGNNPPMEILKANWIREVEVANSSAQYQEEGDEDEEAEDQDARGTSASTSTTGSDDEATLISPSLNGDVVPTFEHQNMPYPTLISHSSSSSTSTDPVPMPHEHPASLTWQTSYVGENATWSEADPSGMLLQHISPQFEALDSGYGYLNQHTDAYLGQWS